MYIIFYQARHVIIRSFHVIYVSEETLSASFMRHAIHDTNVDGSGMSIDPNIWWSNIVTAMLISAQALNSLR